MTQPYSIRPTVVIESPYAGNVERNTLYAKRALLDSLERGEAPFASHLLYTQVLDDTIVRDRARGIDSQMAWIRKCDKVVVYMDYGVSPGMRAAISFARLISRPIEERFIGENFVPTFEDVAYG